MTFYVLCLVLTLRFRIWKEKYDPGNGKKGKK